MAASSLNSAPLGPLGGPLVQAAGRFHDLTVTDADAVGARRWAVWSDGAPGDTTTRLALLSIDGARAMPVWRAVWPHAYSPALRPTPEWSFGGRALLAVTFQYGASAEALELYGLDGATSPVRLVEKLSNAVGWTASPSGELLLILYDRPASALVASCYGWNAGTTALRPTRCPS